MAVNPKIENSWRNALNSCFTSDWFKELKGFLVEEKKNHIVYPPGNLIFSAFNLTPVSAVKVVILGQDPYHGQGQAHGLSFSVPDGVPIPPSLSNIYKEIYNDLATTPPKTGNLTEWAKQGVLLLNATLTVRAGVAASHQGHGWEKFTDEVIRFLSNERDNLVFILWGKPAGQKAELIDAKKHLILKAPHPSPLSAHRGFFGCKHFSYANNYLVQNGIAPISWQLT